jgi:hypothetical protein
MTDWKPIKSAPKDDEILVYDKFYGGVHIAYREGWGWTATDNQKDDIRPILWAEIPYPSQELIDAHNSDEDDEDI